eukprot:gene12645-516_t
MSINDEQIYQTYEKMGLSHDILKGIQAYGWDSPSPIQARAIVPINRGQDVLMQAKAGSGKTGAFGLGALSCIDWENNSVQVVIVLPFQPVAEQVYDVINSLGKKCDRENACMLASGSVGFEDIQAALRRGTKIIVGALGTLSLLHQHIQNCKLLIIDEADEVLQLQTRQLQGLMKVMSKSVQIVASSATITPAMQSFCDSLLSNDPVLIKIEKEEPRAPRIDFYYIAIEGHKPKECDALKADVMVELYPWLSKSKCMVFCNSNDRVLDLYEYMKGAGCDNVLAVSGKKQRRENEQTIRTFRNSRKNLLITSDVLAKGFDDPGVFFVVNFDITRTSDAERQKYIHRVCRCGRFNKTGTAIDLVKESEWGELEHLQSIHNFKTIELQQDMVEAPIKEAVEDPQTDPIKEAVEDPQTDENFQDEMESAVPLQPPHRCEHAADHEANEMEGSTEDVFEQERAHSMDSDGGGLPHNPHTMTPNQADQGYGDLSDLDDLETLSDDLIDVTVVHDEISTLKEEEDDILKKPYKDSTENKSGMNISASLFIPKEFSQGDPILADHEPILSVGPYDCTADMGTTCLGCFQINEAFQSIKNISGAPGITSIFAPPNHKISPQFYSETQHSLTRAWMAEGMSLSYLSQKWMSIAHTWAERVSSSRGLQLNFAALNVLETSGNNVEMYGLCCDLFKKVSQPVYPPTYETPYVSAPPRYHTVPQISSSHPPTNCNSHTNYNYPSDPFQGGQGVTSSHPYPYPYPYPYPNY